MGHGIKKSRAAHEFERVSLGDLIHEHVRVAIERAVHEEVLAALDATCFEHFHVDDAARRLVRFPKAMDVVVAMNQYGEILSDVAGEMAGGLGVAPSANYGDGGWAYFESVHGSAPGHRGQGHRQSDGDNPLGTLDARPYGTGVRVGAARGGAGARLPRRQDAHA